MDDTYQTYLNRVARLTLSATHRSQLQNIQPSPKFKEGQPVPFPGYNVMTPPWKEHPNNSLLSRKLEELQQHLVQQFEPGFMAPVASESFHMTLVDLIWDDAYREAVIQNPNFEEQLCDRIAQCFEQCKPQVSQGKPIEMQLLGLIIRPRALMVGLVPQTEEGYEQLLQLRRSVYQNAGLMALGIEQQYNFTAHITLGYFEAIPSNLDRDRINTILAEFNDAWPDAQLPMLTIERAQLCKFDDMNHFYRKPDWPQLPF